MLSPQTEKFDRTEKFDEYEQIAELSDYVLIDTEIVRVEHFTRSQNSKWMRNVYTQLSQELKLENFGVSVPLAEIYRGIEVSEQGVLPIEAPNIE